MKPQDLCECQESYMVKHWSGVRYILSEAETKEKEYAPILDHSFDVYVDASITGS